MKISSQWARTALTAAVLLLVAAAGRAQDAVSGSISGTITDSTGAFVKGAKVTLTNTDRNHVERIVTTNNAGYYTATALALGNYSVKISNAGFKSDTVTNLVLHVDDALTVNRALTNGDVSESITVTADEARVNLEDATSQGLINNEQLNEMPLLTRNYETLLNLQPGVVYGGSTDNLSSGPTGIGGSSSTVNFSVNGGRSTSNNWTIDGADNVDRGSNLTLYTYPSPDAIAEFKTLRGQYSAQFGRNASGQIDVVTKSGSNQIHGSAFEYLRNDAFDANGYANDYLGLKKAAYRYNVFGGSFGGPVYIPKIYNGRDKTFFFISEEFQRIVTFLSGTSALVPMASERMGDFSQSGVKLPSGAYSTGPVQVCTNYVTNPTTQVNSCTGVGTKVTNISPTAAAYLKDVYANVPLPDPVYDIAHNLDPHTILSTFSNVINHDDTVARIDQDFGQKLHIFYRYLHDTFPEILPEGQFTTVPIPGANYTTAKNPGTQHLGHVSYVFSPTLVLNAGYAFSNGNIISTPSGFLASANSRDINPSLQYANTVGLVPTIAVSGMTSLNGSVAYTDHGTNHQAFGDITKVLKSHTLIGGFSYSHYQKLENNTTGTQGSFGFNTDTAYACNTAGLPTSPNTACVTNTPGYTGGYTEAQAFANFLTGNANSGFSQLSRDPVTDIKYALYEAFIQDNWKATPRLTLNIGVRYGYYGQPWDANYLLSNFDPAKFDPTKAPTVSATGLLCFTAVCSQTGSNAGLSTAYNANADFNGTNYINGLIYNGPTAANNNQASPYGNKVGQAQKDNFAPRFGFAYDVFGDGRTSLRGGYGWSFDDAEVSYYETTVFNNPPSVATYTASQTSLDSPTGGGTPAPCGLNTTNTGCATAGRVQSVPINYQTPYVQQYSLDLQQQISAKTFLDISYFGDHGTHLLGAEEINQPGPPGSFVGKVQPSSSGSACIDPDTNQQSFLNSTCDRVLNQIRPYLGYFAVDALRTIFSSNYNGLQVKFTKKFSGKTYFDANYTFSRDLTNAPADYSGFIQNIYNPNGDYGRAPDDRNNVLTLDGVFELPWYREQHGIKGRLIGGWEISSIYTIQSGLPVTISASSAYTPNYNLPGNVAGSYNGRTNTGYITDNAGLGVLGNTNAGLRLNQIGDPNAGNGIKIHNKGYNQLWFNTSAFAAAPPSQTNMAPTARRGTIQGPGFNRADIGVFRNFRIYNRLMFQFRAEAFNAANHTNVQSFVSSAGSSTYFGLTQGYRDARQVQFAGRFTF
jgi:hypothetical protein